MVGRKAGKEDGYAIGRIAVWQEGLLFLGRMPRWQEVRVWMLWSKDGCVVRSWLGGRKYGCVVGRTALCRTLAKW